MNYHRPRTCDYYNDQRRYVFFVFFFITLLSEGMRVHGEGLVYAANSATVVAA